MVGAAATYTIIGTNNTSDVARRDDDAIVPRLNEMVLPEKDGGEVRELLKQHKALQRF
jgi:hypothetical protein